ncbi:MAG TPA: acylphosphatase [Fervidobacterium sp.]|nr:acylphosphatase [Fervidobacterium sp.]HOK88009.1 acylphosphatase [Fervidobacterium sp.]HOM74422.1 acylphosphatase [Fervidobacterium sp.]HPP18057.1 acylphosphatase [Fervidobacterium sp.]HPT53873.1 acylphosphatase [Fervidobacterium sp.]
MDMIWKKWNIVGIVQGVGFRHFVKNSAKLIGVKGYIKNEADGSVTIVAGGNIEQLNELLKRAIEGNGWSYVYRVDENDLSPQEYTDFHVEF